MKAKALETSPEYYKKYIALVEDKALYEIFESGGIDLYLEEIEKLEEIGDKVYAPGKWTVRQIVQHLTDTERVFAYRALRFVRNDVTALPGYDENLYAESANVNNKKLSDLLEEYQILRLSNAYFFNKLTDEELLRIGTANGNEISVLAIGYVLIGHAVHHFNVIQEKYMNLV